MDAHEVVAEPGHPMGLAGDLLARGEEERVGGQVAAPEPGGRAVGEDEAVAIGPDEAAAPGRPVVPIQEAEIDGARRPAPERRGTTTRIGRIVAFLGRGRPAPSGAPGSGSCVPDPARERREPRKSGRERDQHRDAHRNHQTNLPRQTHRPPPATLASSRSRTTSHRITPRSARQGPEIGPRGRRGKRPVPTMPATHHRGDRVAMALDYSAGVEQSTSASMIPRRGGWFRCRRPGSGRPLVSSGSSASAFA